MPLLLAIDVGNTSTTLGLFQGEQLLEQRSLLHGAPLPAPLFRTGTHARAVGASVAPSQQGPFQVLGGVPTVWLRSGSFPLLKIEVPSPESVGVDRLANALGALQLSPQEGALVIDVGTAITWDLVSPEGAFLGGAIGPGPQLSFTALHNSTERLPLGVLPEELPQGPGRSTLEALQRGVLWGACGALKEVAERILHPLPFTPRRFLTGGYAQALLPALSSTYQYDPALTLRGIVAAAKELYH